LLPQFILTDTATWSPTLLHNDDHTTSLLNHDMAVSDKKEDDKVCQIVNVPVFPTQYVIHRSDESTIDSDDLIFIPDS
jgi:hypothetical protein